MKNGMAMIDLSKIKDEIARDVYSACLSEKTIRKHVIDYTWLSGCSTNVSPIMMYSKDVEVHVDTHNSFYFRNAIKRVLSAYPHIFKNGYFCKSDGSCPSYIRFIYSDTHLARINNNK